MISTQPVDLSILVPAYDEEDRLPRALDGIRRSLVTHPEISAEVIVIDDGSRDGTARLVREAASSQPGLRLVALERNRGKGAAVRAGVHASRGRWIVFTDADLSVDLRLLWDLVDDLEIADVAIASRALPGALLLHRQSLARETVAKLYAGIVRLLVLRGIPDAHCGLKAFRRDAARSIFGRVREDRALFDCEAMLVAALQGRPITQRPAAWRHDPETRMPMTPREIFTIVTGLVRLKIRHRSIWPPRARVITRGAGR